MARFGHMVFFELKEDSSEARSQLVAGCRKYLAEHPGTIFFDAGELAATHRDVNDRDFHVALHLVFEDRAAHDAYQTAPRHGEFIEQYQSNWKKVRVFDSELLD